MTELTDYVKLLYARVGQLHCRKCGKPVVPETPEHVWKALEGVAEGSELVVIQDVADHADLAMRKIIRRMHLMARNMLTEAFNSVKDVDATLAKEVIERDDEVDRLYWFVEKQHSMTTRNPMFAAKLKTDLIESNAMMAAAKALERIADHASRIAHATTVFHSSKAPVALLGRSSPVPQSASS